MTPAADAGSHGECAGLPDVPVAAGVAGRAGETVG